jgi:hypothetical protein
MSPNGKWYGLWDGSGAFGVKQDQEDSSNNIFYEETAAVITKSQRVISCAYNSRV